MEDAYIAIGTMVDSLGDVYTKFLTPKEYKEEISTPFYAASRGYIDEIITPQNTRKKICDVLRFLRNKKVGMPRKKHDNLPL